MIVWPSDPTPTNAAERPDEITGMALKFIHARHEIAIGHDSDLHH